MKFSRRNFLKAASQGIALTAVGIGSADSVSSPALPRAAPNVRRLRFLPQLRFEKATFLINSPILRRRIRGADDLLVGGPGHEAGADGTNRSCNKASCGACSVLVEWRAAAIPATRWRWKPQEEDSDNRRRGHGRAICTRCSESGHTHVAADCGFCTAGWVVHGAKGLLDKNRHPSEDEVKAALAGHICRCSAYPSIVRHRARHGAL